MSGNESDLQAEVERIVRSMVSYEDEPRAIGEIMALFEQHHCASCDMHSCGDGPAAPVSLRPPRAPKSMGDLRWPIESHNPDTGRPWTASEREAMSLPGTAGHADEQEASLAWPWTKYLQDDRVMCQLCFDLFEREELVDADEPGMKQDVCKGCAIHDAEMARRKEAGEPPFDGKPEDDNGAEDGSGV